ncbi:MAG: D-glucuronyl C5-epimerase family protein [bacterium]|nr:D-glucuronyl C5-epimerase family protein [bacterium]
MKVNNDIHLGCGNISLDKELGGYYQDLREAIYHFDNNSLGRFDDKGIPYLVEKERDVYSIVYVIQYALIQYEFMVYEGESAERLEIFKNCISWLDEKAENFKDAVVWRSAKNIQYDLDEGWVSSMYQGQAASLYLRAYQLLGNETYLETAEKAIAFLQYDYSEGGVKRVDENGFTWFEEYPTDPPSYVLNGFIYTLFGMLDLYRVTGSENAKALYDECINTLENNLHQYHRWYWSVYDQKKEQLVSYYYQKNVHIPLMEILSKLTKKPIFATYHSKWKRQLSSPLNRMIVQLMYRIQPRLKRLRK